MPGYVWVSAHILHRDGKIVYIRAHWRKQTPSQHAVEHRLAAATGETANDAAQAKARRRPADVKVYLRRKLGKRNDSGAIPRVDTVVSANDDKRPVIPASDTSGSNNPNGKTWIPDFAEQKLHDQGHHYRQGREAARAWARKPDPNYVPPNNADFRRGFNDELNKINKSIQDALDRLKGAIGTGAAADVPKNVTFDDKQLQKKFAKHATDFGITGNYSPENAARFQQRLKDFVQNAPNRFPGTYRGTQPANYYVDPQSRLVVMTNTNLRSR